MSQGISQNLSREQAIYECSPSQVSTYELCARKWAWSWLDGLYGPPHKSAVFGKKVHRFLELWLKKRVLPSGGPEAKVAQIMLPHLPPPHLVDPDHVEMSAGIVIGGIRFIMEIDLLMPELQPPVVYDHKSTSSFDWALRSDVMDEDVQATLYAAWALVATGAPKVATQWTYGLTVGAPKAMPVRAELTLEMIEDRVGRSVKSAHEMKLLIDEGTTAIDVPYDANGCGAFGGCPFQEKCNLSPQDRLRSIMSQGTAKEDYLIKLRARKGANGAAVGAVNPPPVAQAAPPPAAAAPPPATAAPPPATAAPPPAPAAGAPRNKLAERAAARKAAAAAAAAPVETVAAPVPEAEPAAEPAATEEAPKRTRGRPAGATSAPKPATPEDHWVAFASSAVQPLIVTLSPDDVVDPEMQEGVAQTAGAYADALLREYLSRFGG
jgi:hypothetical protein